MNPNDLQQLSARLARLESFNRRLSRAVVVLLLVLASTVWMGQQKPTTKAPRRKAPPPPTPKVVEAEQFVLKSASGHVFATLEMSDGGPMLRLAGADGRDRARLAVDAGGMPRLVLLRADGSEPVSVMLTPEGLPRLELAAPDKSAARIAIGTQGPGIGLVDAAGVVRLALDLKPDGPIMALVDSNKVTRATLDTVEATSPDVLWGPNLKMFDPDGRARIALSVRPGLAAFNLQDSSGRPSVGLQVRSDKPALGLYGPNGKELFVKP